MVFCAGDISTGCPILCMCSTVIFSLKVSDSTGKKDSSLQICTILMKRDTENRCKIYCFRFLGKLLKNTQTKPKQFCGIVLCLFKISYELRQIWVVIWFNDQPLLLKDSLSQVDARASGFSSCIRRAM